MRKSVPNQSLLLFLVSLIMLVPFTSINFSNVKAQEYGAYDDDKYSQYPTDDKKYECRTGPFEGFIVSSVEFCKHVKFDDRKNNNSVEVNDGNDGNPIGIDDLPTCKDCFSRLSSDQLNLIIYNLAQVGWAINDVKGICDFLAKLPHNEEAQKEAYIELNYAMTNVPFFFEGVSISDPEKRYVLLCLQVLFLIIPP